MKQNRKRAKDIIKHSTRTQYFKIIEEAFLTVRQEKILLMKKTKDITNWEIANILNVSVDTVNHELLNIYDKLIKVIDGV